TIAVMATDFCCAWTGLAIAKASASAPNSTLRDMVKDIEGSFAAVVAGQWWTCAIADRDVRKILKNESLTARPGCATAVDPEPCIQGTPLAAKAVFLYSQRNESSVCRTPLPQQLQLPARRLAPRGARHAGRGIRLRRHRAHRRMLLRRHRARPSRAAGLARSRPAQADHRQRRSEERRVGKAWSRPRAPWQRKRENGSGEVDRVGRRG